MKSIITFFVILLGLPLLAQPAHSFNYQAVLRDTSGSEIVNQNVGLKFSILAGSATGTAVYEETHTAQTNAFGLVTIAVGGGTVTSGDISTIDWGANSYFLQVEMDPTGGTSYMSFGTQELLYVPYALHAASADDVDDADADPTNELQSLSLSADSLKISDGNYVLLPAAPQNLDNDSTNELQSLSINVDTLMISNGNWVLLPPDNVMDADADTTNELQLLSLNADTLMISNGNYVLLADGDTSRWSSDNNGIHYSDGHVGIGGDAWGNASLTIDHRSNNNSKVQIIGQEQSFNTIEFVESNFNKRISLGMASVSGYDNAFTVGTNTGNWTNPFVIDLGAPTKSLYVDSVGDVGIGTGGDPIAALEVYQNNGTTTQGNIGARAVAEGSSYENVGVWGVTNGGAANHWENVGVRAEANTDSGAARALSAFVVGDNQGYAVFGEASTDNQNTAISGVGMSKTGNNTYTVGVWGTAQGDWDPSLGIGQGTHVGVRGEAVSDSGWALGMAAYSNSNSGPSRALQASGATVDGSFSQGLAGFATAASSDTASENSGVIGVASGAGGSNYGVYGYNVSAAGNHNAGVYGYNGSSTSSTYGVDGTTVGTGDFNVGAGGYAHGSNTGSKLNVGVHGWAANADTNIAVYAEANFSSSNQNVAIVGVASNAADSKAALLYGDVVVTGNLDVTGNISKGGGTFKIDHPTDPQNKYLVHSFVESPEMLNVYSGNVITDGEGNATVTMPNYFEAANKDYRYQLTPIGQFAQAIVLEEVKENTFKIKTDKPNVKISWQVTAVRADKYAEQNRIVPEQEKEGARKGTYLHPELYGVERTAVGLKGLRNSKVNKTVNPSAVEFAAEEPKAIK